MSGPGQMKRERSVLPGMIGPYRPEKKLGSGQVRKRRKKGWLEEGRGGDGQDPLFAIAEGTQGNVLLHRCITHCSTEDDRSHSQKYMGGELSHGIYSL